MFDLKKIFYALEIVHPNEASDVVVEIAALRAFVDQAPALFPRLEQLAGIVADDDAEAGADEQQFVVELRTIAATVRLAQSAPARDVHQVTLADPPPPWRATAWTDEQHVASLRSRKDDGIQRLLRLLDAAQAMLLSAGIEVNTARTERDVERAKNARLSQSMQAAHDKLANESRTFKTVERERDEARAVASREAQAGRHRDHQLATMIRERDHAVEWADRLAYTIGSIEEIGEHSSMNDPWANAVEHLKGQRQQRVRHEHTCAWPPTSERPKHVYLRDGTKVVLEGVRLAWLALVPQTVVEAQAPGDPDSSGDPEKGSTS